MFSEIMIHSPIAKRVKGDVGRLRALGNAIVPQVGAVFVKAFMEIEEEG